MMLFTYHIAGVQVVEDFGFIYDSSVGVPPLKTPMWPYTLDYKIPHECKSGTCPTKSFPGKRDLGRQSLELIFLLFMMPFQCQGNLFVSQHRFTSQLLWNFERLVKYLPLILLHDFDAFEDVNLSKCAAPLDIFFNVQIKTSLQYWRTHL